MNVSGTWWREEMTRIRDEHRQALARSAHRLERTVHVAAAVRPTRTTDPEAGEDVPRSFLRPANLDARPRRRSAEEVDEQPRSSWME